MTEKRCKGCGAVKALSEFSRRNRLCPTLHAHCRACSNAAGRVAHARSMDTKLVQKACTACGETKPLAEFFACKRVKDGRQAQCKACRGRLYNATKNALRRTPEALARRRAAYAKNAMRERARSSAWSSAHRDRRNAYAYKKYHTDPKTRARIINDGACRRSHYKDSSLTAQDWLLVLEDYAGRCAYCFGGANALDHVLPLSRGGKHELGNVVPACKSCNSSKYTRTPVEWLGGKPGGTVLIGGGMAMPFGV
jgi:5-methylcytosine-specific restriction endonuclease McrA